MKIQVFGEPEVREVCGTLSTFLWGLVLKVDTAFDCDGTYHVYKLDLADALFAANCPVAAHTMIYELERRGLSHIAIPHNCCHQIFEPAEQIGV